MTIVLTSDHAGYHLKEAIKSYLSDHGFAVVDMGPFDDQTVDYPDYAAAAAREISEGRIPRGIFVCGSGIGMAMVANRFKGVRAVHCLDAETAVLARKHNDANVLTLGGRTTSEETTLKIVDVFLNTPFDGGRHQRRVEKFDKLTQSSIECSPNGKS
jgi:ribose 5-phosphate isomerase B